MDRTKLNRSIVFPNEHNLSFLHIILISASLCQPLLSRLRAVHPNIPLDPVADNHWRATGRTGQIDLRQVNIRAHRIRRAG